MSDKTSMDEATAHFGRGVLFLCLKFAVLAPACLALWLAILPGYVWLVGQFTAFFLKTLAGTPIEALTVGQGAQETAVAPSSAILKVLYFLIIKTGTTLSFYVDGRTMTMNDIGHLTCNIAPFVALVLSTGGLRLLRRLRVLGIGFAILFCSHVLTIFLRYNSPERAGLSNAVGFISITLPFLLWLVLAYWDKLMAFIGAEKGPDNP